VLALQRLRGVERVQHDLCASFLLRDRH
jgi:hypothetical protein